MNKIFSIENMLSVIGALLTVIALRVSSDIKDLSVDFRELSKSVQDLNSKVAGVLISNGSHEKRIEILESYQRKR